MPIWSRSIHKMEPQLPAIPRYPLPAVVVGDRPTNLGIADLKVAADGTVWIARDGALSLTAFSPTAQTFQETPLPATAGDPIKLAIGPAGHVFFVTNLSADHSGHAFERIGELDPATGTTQVIIRNVQSVAVGPAGDMYSAFADHAVGLARLSAQERANAKTGGRLPAFSQIVLPFDVDDTAIALDTNGRVWVAEASQPKIAAVDTHTGQVSEFQYAVPDGLTGGFSRPRLGSPLPQAISTRVRISHMVAMTTDAEGHLWYIRAGSSQIEEVAA